jgi:hypothetical protein
VIVAPPPPVALSVSPTRVELAGAGSATIRLTNTGRTSAVVDGARAGFAIDVSGRPRVAVLRDLGVRVLVRPRRAVLTPGGEVAATIVVRVGRRASPGDHPSLVVFATRPRSSAGVGVRLRVGVVVVVRVPGAIVHRLRLAGVRALRHRVTILVRNLGNVVERLGPATLRVRLTQRGHIVRRLPVPTRELLPGGQAVLRFAAPLARGRVIVELHGGDDSTVRSARLLRAGRGRRSRPTHPERRG